MKPTPEDDPKSLPGRPSGEANPTPGSDASRTPPVDHSGGRFDAGESLHSPLPQRTPSSRSTLGRGILSTASEVASPAAGLRRHPFGDYELLEIIGIGGMGTVWKARHLILAVMDAVKVVSGGRLASPTCRRMFLDEMRTLARLSHPHIVKIRTAGESDDELYFSMVYESGGDLAALVKKNGPQAPERAADLVRQVAEAVEYAHQQKVVHCDLKPHNVLLSADGTPKVTDFGLALLLTRGEDGRPADGEPVGTPSYMPPEQAKGEHDKIGPASDVYGLGAVLYELLTGRPPFPLRDTDDVDETLRQVKDDPLRRPRAFNPNIPRRLEAICLKCLEKDPRKRYATAGRAADALRDFLRPWWKRVWRRAAVAAAFGLLCGMLLWSGYEGYRGPRAEAAVRENTAVDARKMGKNKEAVENYKAAKELYQKLADSPFPQPDRSALRFGLARVRTGLGQLQEEGRNEAEAKEEWDNARTLLEGLHKGDPGRPDYKRLLAEVHNRLGEYAVKKNEWKEAKECFRRGLRLREELLDSRPDDDQSRRDLALSYGWLGDAQLILCEDADALKDYQEAMTLRGALAEKKPTPDSLCLHARDFGNLGHYHDWRDEVDDAVKWNGDCLDWYEKNAATLGARLPEEYLTERADTRVGLAELKLDRPAGDLKDVRKLLKDAEDEYDSLRKDLGDEDPRCTAGLARLYVVRARYFRAEGRSPEDQKGAAVKAQGLIDSLVKAGKASPGDYYRLALAWALQAPGEANAPKRAIAQTDALSALGSAVARNFNNLRRLERDAALLRPDDPDQREEFARYLAGVREKYAPALP